MNLPSGLAGIDHLGAILTKGRRNLRGCAMNDRIILEELLIEKIATLYENEKQQVTKILLQKSTTDDLLKLADFIEKSGPSL